MIFNLLYDDNIFVLVMNRTDANGNHLIKKYERLLSPVCITFIILNLSGYYIKWRTKPSNINQYEATATFRQPVHTGINVVIWPVYL
jgi:hypothetical protein